MNVNQLLASRIRHFRLLKNITLESLAKDLGVSKAAMSQLENGHTEITMNKINAISQILKVPLREFLDGIIE